MTNQGERELKVKKNKSPWRNQMKSFFIKDKGENVQLFLKKIKKENPR